MKTAHPLTYALLGAVAALALMVVTGAGHSPEAVGRYQISTCLKRDWVYVYVIDTVTGEVRFVDEKNENKPFPEIKSTR
ncbi:MAG TPA: hypothetical protein VLM89_16490 [Phycisphaerae bacterium]|nr:hypothetical protein [Phycisphaerae bacterium]